jgi:ligand-binding sensor domain-containing protein/DNA-binding CsgD family transcriptional regulator
MNNLKIYSLKRPFLLLLSIYISSLVSAAWTPIIHHYTPKNYEAGTQNWDIVQQSNGWMYIANNYGLLETDGCGWNLYGINNSSALRSVTLDDEGNIYVGGTDEFGVFLADGLGGLKYENLSIHVPASYRHFGEVWRLQVAKEKLYIQTRHYIFIYKKGEGVEVIDPGAIIYESLVWEGNLYVATSRDLYVQSGGRLHALRGAESLHNIVVCGLFPYGKEGMMIATDFHGLFLYDGKSVKPFRTDADEYIKENQLYTLTLNEQKLALGTVQGGVVLADLDGKNCQYITRENGLQNNTILSLLFDQKGNIWMGLDNGIDVAETSNPILFYRDKYVDYGAGYTSYEYNGGLYIGTNQGLYFQDNPKNNLKFVAGSNGQVWSVCNVGSTLFCCHNRGLFVVDNMRLKPLDCSDGVWKVTPLSDSTAIVGTYIGFYYLYREGRQWQLQYLDGFSETALYHVIDAKDNIWILTSRGIERCIVDIANRKVYPELIIEQPSAQRVYSLTEWNNLVYITSDDYYALVNENGDFCPNTALDVLPCGKRYLNVCEDIHKNVWYIYDNRVAMREYDATNHSYKSERVVYYSSSLLIGGFSNLTPSMSGGVLIGGVDGFYRMQHSNTQLNTNNTIYIRKISSLTDAPVIIYGEPNDNSVEEITIPSSYRALHVEFSGANAIGDKPLFRTRLYPVEEAFTPWQSLSYRDFIALPLGGDFRLDIEMLSTENGNVISRSIPINLQYPFYFTWWAKGLYVLLGILFLLLLSWKIYRNVQRSKMMLEEKKNKEISQQQMRILQLENEKAQFDLRNKSQELSNILLSEANRKEWNEDVLNEMRRIIECLNNDRIAEAKGKLQHLQNRIARNGEKSINWKRFEENFDIVNNQFITRLTKFYPWMSKQERRLCVYIHMGLSSKEIAPLLNLSTRGVEMMRYRIRSKMDVDSAISLKQHFLNIQQSITQ